MYSEYYEIRQGHILKEDASPVKAGQVSTVVFLVLHVMSVERYEVPGFVNSAQTLCIFFCFKFQ